MQDEVTITDLEVKGSIPPELSGRYIRNTPNPQTGYTEHWFIGDGMLHGMELKDGKANWYRNRYIRTPMFDNPGADRLTLALDPETFTFDHKVSAANTHIVGHGGKILALEEGSFPYEVNADLDTVGAHNFGGKLNGPFTAHPKFCAETGDMLGFGYAQVEPYLTYYRVNAAGELVQSTEITVPGPTMMHDFAASRNHSIFMDLPVVFDMEMAMQGGMPFHWDDNYEARFGVMPRDGGDADVRWFNVDPCFVFHTMNAHEEGDDVVVYGCRSPEMWRDTSDISMSDAPDPGEAPALHEWRFNMATGAVSERALDDQGAEFPRIPEHLQGLKTEYGYTIGMGNTADGSDAMAGRLCKYRLSDGERQVHDFPVGHEPGEAVFVPADGGTNSDDGYLMTYVWQPETDTSYMAILDATDMAADPIAEVHVPRRIVSGFHTSWIADA